MEYDCIKELEENSYEVYIEVSSILLKLLDNVIKYPTNPKYRRLRLANAIISEKLLNGIGAMECLFSMGFKEDGDALFLPNDVAISSLQKFRDQIQLRKSSLKEGSSGNQAHSSSPSNLEMSSSTGTLKINRNSIKPENSNVNSEGTEEKQPRTNQSPPQTATTESKSDVKESSKNQSRHPSSQKSEETHKEMLEGQEFLSKIETIFDEMSRYEDKNILAKALEIIPRQEMYDKVKRQLDDPSYMNKSIAHPYTQELLLSELLKWFKMSFFTWVDKPQCPSCQGPTISVGELASNDAAISRIEEYKCEKCGTEVPFPRYESLEILLQSRKGRCGEWANVFTLFCRALKWDARFVYDITDHVWTEVYSIQQKRWLHCDPCEAALDTPLMYEKGWGKKLSYVIAFSFEEVQDVTWRYSSDHQNVRARRKAVGEQELINTILSLSKKRQSVLSPERNQLLLHRRMAELVEFLVPPKATEDYSGRTSGSEEWRKARGELNNAIQKPHNVWKPSPAALKSLKFQVEYSTSLDKYVDRSTGQELLGWENGVYTAESIFRKEELDWKTAYLARIEGCEVGKIEWKFSFESCGVAVDQINIRCPSTVYENGTIKWYLCNEGECVELPQGEEEFVSKATPGALEITLCSKLENGKGDQAWQHAQLFRQSVDSSEFIFSITFTLKPLEEKDS